MMKKTLLLTSLLLSACTTQPSQAQLEQYQAAKMTIWFAPTQRQQLPEQQEQIEIVINIM